MYFSGMELYINWAPSTVQATAALVSTSPISLMTANNIFSKSLVWKRHLFVKKSL